jgi:anthranilate 1,2-dioxygenase small subunit
MAPRPVDGPTYDMVAGLISEYAHALDDGNIDRWPGFFTEAALYHVTTRENHDQGLPIGLIRCKGRGMMVDRVKAFHTANIFEPHSYNHLLGPASSTEITAQAFDVGFTLNIRHSFDSSACQALLRLMRMG